MITKKISITLVLFFGQMMMAAEPNKKETTMRYYIQEVLVKCIQRCPEKDHICLDTCRKEYRLFDDFMHHRDKKSLECSRLQSLGFNCSRLLGVQAYNLQNQITLSDQQKEFWELWDKVMN